MLRAWVRGRTENTLQHTSPSICEQAYSTTTKFLGNSLRLQDFSPNTVE